MKRFEAGKEYGEYCTTGRAYKTKCTRVTPKMAYFETVYGLKRMKINRHNQPYEAVILLGEQ